MSAGRIRRWAVWLAVFLIGPLAGAGIATVVRNAGEPVQAAGKIEPGSEVFSIAADEILSLSYGTDELTLIVQRTKQTDRFAVQVTYADGRPAQQCIASPDLARQLASFTLLVAKRQVPMGRLAADYPKRSGVVEIKDLDSIREDVAGGISLRG